MIHEVDTKSLRDFQRERRRQGEYNSSHYSSNSQAKIMANVSCGQTDGQKQYTTDLSIKGYLISTNLSRQHFVEENSACLQSKNSN